MPLQHGKRDHPLSPAAPPPPAPCPLLRPAACLPLVPGLGPEEPGVPGRGASLDAAGAAGGHRDDAGGRDQHAAKPARQQAPVRTLFPELPTTGGCPQ